MCGNGASEIAVLRHAAICVALCRDADRSPSCAVMQDDVHTTTQLASSDVVLSSLWFDKVWALTTDGTLTVLTRAPADAGVMAGVTTAAVSALDGSMVAAGYTYNWLCLAAGPAGAVLVRAVTSPGGYVNVGHPLPLGGGGCESWGLMALGICDGTDGGCRILLVLSIITRVLCCGLLRAGTVS